LNSHFDTTKSSYLVSNRLTVADIVIATELLPVYQSALDGGFRKAMGAVSQWVENFSKLPEVSSVLGNVKFVAKTWKPFVSEKKSK
jgi:glutathione S-transferase